MVSMMPDTAISNYSDTLGVQILAVCPRLLPFPEAYGMHFRQHAVLFYRLPSCLEVR